MPNVEDLFKGTDAGIVGHFFEGLKEGQAETKRKAEAKDLQRTMKALAVVFEKTGTNPLEAMGLMKPTAGTATPGPGSEAPVGPAIESPAPAAAAAAPSAGIPQAGIPGIVAPQPALPGGAPAGMPPAGAPAAGQPSAGAPSAGADADHGIHFKNGSSIHPPPGSTPEQIQQASLAFQQMAGTDPAKAVEALKSQGWVLAGAAAPAPIAPALATAAELPAAGQPSAGGDPFNQRVAGILNAVAGSEYPAQSIAATDKLFGPIPVKEEGKDIYDHAPGSTVTDKHGKILFKVPDKPGKPSLGVSEKGWLTIVHEDGTQQELVGIKPMQTTVAAINAESRKLSATEAAAARVEAARILAQGGVDREQMKAIAAKSLTKFKFDLAKQADPKTVAHYYVQLLEAYRSGEADQGDILMMEYLRPIVEKQGMLGMLLQGGEGGAAKPSGPPWKPAAPPTPPVEEKKGSIFSFLGLGDSTPAPAAPAAPTAATPAVPKAAVKGVPKAESGGGFTAGNVKLTAPSGTSNADVKTTMDSYNAKIKAGYSPKELHDHLRKKGWKVN